MKLNPKTLLWVVAAGFVLFVLVRPSIPETDVDIEPQIDPEPFVPAAIETAEIRQCKAAQAAYFESHFEEFFGESGNNKLKGTLANVIKQRVNEWESPFVVDVGANRGQLFDSLPMRVPEKASYVLFEPNPVNIELLKSKFGDRANVKIMEMAVSNFDGEAAFFFQHWNGEGNEHGALGPTFQHRDTNASTPVKVAQLDTVFFDPNLPELYKHEGHINLLKTDTEGFDVLVHRGAKRLLKGVEMLLFECHLLQQKEHGGPGTTHLESSKELGELGFHVYKVGHVRLVRFDGPYYPEILDKKMEWQNCFAIKQGHPWEADILAGFESYPECQAAYAAEKQSAAATGATKR